MTLSLKPFSYPADSQAAIDVFSALSREEQETELITLAAAEPVKAEKLLHSFHCALNKLVEGRSQEEEVPAKFSLPEETLDQIFSQMVTGDIFFSYDSGQDFMMALDQATPSLFQDSCNVLSLVAKHFAKRKKKAGQIDFPPEINEEVLGKLKAITKKTEDAYEVVIESLAQVKIAKKTNELYHAKDPNTGIEQVKEAKKIFEEYHVKFVESAKIIADGMPYIYQAFQAYSDDRLLLGIYSKYLAKLLASREAKYPVEQYLLILAKGKFQFELEEISLSEQDLQREKTIEQKNAEIMAELKIPIARLESRYRKRKLMTKLAQGAQPHTIIKELIALAEIDADDIRTHILLARMVADYSKTIQNTAKRISLREQALHFCELAFVNIDGFMDLQGVLEVKDRDRTRVGFVKTISAIRLPLIRGKG